VDEVILNTVPKNGRAENLCSARELVVKLFMAIHVNNEQVIC
jgi:hypothetical protein